MSGRSNTQIPFGRRTSLPPVFGASGSDALSIAGAALAAWVPDAGSAEAAGGPSAEETGGVTETSAVAVPVAAIAGSVPVGAVVGEHAVSDTSVTMNGLASRRGDLIGTILVWYATDRARISPMSRRVTPSPNLAHSGGTCACTCAP